MPFGNEFRLVCNRGEMKLGVRSEELRVASLQNNRLKPIVTLLAVTFTATRSERVSDLIEIKLLTKEKAFNLLVAMQPNF